MKMPRLSSPSADKHMCNVLGREAREGPYTQDQARRLMAETARVNVATLSHISTRGGSQCFSS